MADKDLVKKSLLRRNSDSAAIDYGKLPPQAKELEEAVLGAILIEKQAMIEVAEILKPEVFYLDSHQRIYKAISDLYKKSNPIDLLTVTEQLKKNGELDASGGPYYVAQLTTKIGSAANVEYHSRVLQEKYIQRQLISISTEVIKDAYEDTTDPIQLHSNAITSFDSLMSDNSSDMSFYDHVTTRMTDVGQIKAKGKVLGVQTYIENYDQYIGGFMGGELIIIAGRPAMGKSALMVDWAYNQAKRNIPIGIFSLEMQSAQIVDRIISNASSVPYEKMRKNSMTDEEHQRFNAHGLDVSELPICIDDTGGIELNQLVSKAKKWKHQKKIGALYIDYLQLVESGQVSKGKFSNREQEISTVTRRLKKLAKELDIPIFAFSQLSRKVEERSDKRPVLADLRESGAIEQDADIVLFPFRPGYYKLKNEAKDDYDFTYAEIITGKFRGSSIKDIKTPMQIQYSRFIRSQLDFNFESTNPVVATVFKKSETTEGTEKPDDDTPF